MNQILARVPILKLTLTLLLTRTLVLMMTLTLTLTLIQMMTLVLVQMKILVEQILEMRAKKIGDNLQIQNKNQTKNKQINKDHSNRLFQILATLQCGECSRLKLYGP